MIIATHGIVASQIASYAFLLDLYPSAAAAYSVRKLQSAYTGSAIRVRRSSDNTEQDIGFVNNVLDTSSLTTFCGSGNGFVTTWYDQSGNARDVTQTNAANQPQIVSSGSVITATGIGAAKPALLFDGSNDVLTRNIFSFTDYSVFSIHKKSSVTTSSIVAYQNGNSGGYGLNTSSNGGANYSLYEAGVADHNFGTPTTNLTLISGVRVQSSSILNGYVNSTLFTMSPNPINTPSGSFGLGAFPNGNLPFFGYQSELIFYSSNQTSNITGIQSNINTYYGIY